MIKRFLLTSIFLGLTGFYALAHAEVPVYDESQNYVSSGQDQGVGQAQSQPYTTAENQEQMNQAYGNNNYAPPQPAMNSGSLPDRVTKLEQQFANIQQMNLVAQIQSLQQEVQMLQGQLEMQSHKVSLLESQFQNKSLSSNPAMPQPSSESIKSNSFAEGNAGTATSPPKTDSQLLEEQSTYQKAYQLIANKKYQNAIVSLQNYLKKYPQGNYDVNAHYWLGELYYLQHDMKNAESEFTTVINNYPQDQKIPDAKLKLGFVYSDTGQVDKAKQTLAEIVKTYPGTTTARLAEQRLRSLKHLN